MQGLKAGIKAGIIPGRVGNGDNPCVVIILSFGCNRGRMECRFKGRVERQVSLTSDYFPTTSSQLHSQVQNHDDLSIIDAIILPTES